MSAENTIELKKLILTSENISNGDTTEYKRDDGETSENEFDSDPTKNKSYCDTIENNSKTHVKFVKTEFQNDSQLPNTYSYPQHFQVNYNKLEADLIKEIKTDELYWLQNAAKLRAVNQPGTYEEFRQIVLGAHLKPLKKDESDGLRNDTAKGKVVWNTLANNNGKRNEIDYHGNELANEKIQFHFDELPKSMVEFCRTWKKCMDVNTKLNFLKYIYQYKIRDDYTQLNKVFTEELPPEILPEILDVFLMTILKYKLETKIKDVEFILYTLQIIAKNKKFHLTRAFLSQTDIKNLKVIFKILEDTLNNKEESESEDYQEPKPVYLLNTIIAQYNLESTDEFS